VPRQSCRAQSTQPALDWPLTSDHRHHGMHVKKPDLCFRWVINWVLVMRLSGMLTGSFLHFEVNGFLDC
jgi:hypothetical protein